MAPGDLASLLESGPWLGLGLALVCFLEVLPPLGRFVPGHLVVAGAGAAVFVMESSPAWLLAGAAAGALAGDLVNYARALHHPRLVLAGGEELWLPGSAMDRLERALRSRPFRTVVLRRFFTRDRALLPLVAGGWNARSASYLPAALVACAVWSVAWIAAGYAAAFVTRFLPPALSVAAAVVIMLVLSRPLAQRPREEAEPA